MAYNLNQEGYICSLINANHDNLYAGFFHIGFQNGHLQTLEKHFTFLDLKDACGNLDVSSLVCFIEQSGFLNVSNPIYFVGDGAILYQNLLENLPFKIKVSSLKDAVISSITIGHIGYTNYKDGNYGTSAVLSPIYLRKSQAELALEEKQK